MRKLAALGGVALLGLSAQTAFGYNQVANLTFTFGGSAVGASQDQSFNSASGAYAMGGYDNTTVFSQLAGAGSTVTYNQDFTSAAQCVAGAGLVPASGTTTGTRKYGCRYTSSGGTPLFAAASVVDVGPVGMASGILTATDTTLTGTLNLLSTTDEPTGATTTFASGATGTTRLSNSIGDGLNGYNYRLADGSPFGNAWYGTTTLGTYTVNLTGIFTDTAWTVTGGAVTYVDAGFACQQGGFGGDSRGTLCSGSTTGGGFNPNGSGLSWGMDVDAASTGSTVAGMIDVRDAAGTSTIATLAGAIASISIDGLGNLTTGSGEFRRAVGAAAGGCLNHIRYDTGSGKLACGSITAGNLSISGVVPVPAAVWLMGSALGLLGWIRRKAAA